MTTFSAVTNTHGGQVAPNSPIKARRANMAFHDVVMSRTATKHFDRRKVPADQVRALQDLIRHAASAFNLQPWRAVIVEDDARKRDLAEATWNQPQITTCSNLFVFCANTDLEALVAQLEDESIRSGIPADTVQAFIGAVRDFTVQLHGTERLSWAQRQTFLALANGINGARSLGFDSCPMEGFDPGGYSEILSLPSTLVPTVLMPIGYPSTVSREKLRFAHDEMFLEDTARA
ncbi:MAG: NAD(P)H-dependent oxidoreductase [Actinobacteria bacterium]|nr:NAD(P)H-dependent oxidoreductase [Actinomycetota bacterium]